MKQSGHNPPSEELAFKSLFDRYYDSIRNFLYYKSGNRDLAEDLAQDAFMILWKKRANIDPNKVKSYLYTIANNLFLNEVKHQKVVFKFQQQPISTTSVETPQYIMEEEEFRSKLDHAISSLPEKNRVVFLMNRIEKLTYREIAERLEISVKAVEKRMHKALLELRQIHAKI
ncbi:RNA polymerase sigma-70 factor [Pontibacter sp. G13]|uniref:RNA polymerase sigma factor n=1 Tax=Pontibacter sp. G13 TaxID=3074898 RepID=UPI00288B20F7|nr:RNA polymerase sigma-70 factor [Pontibacter sp. G13]WNJ15935.1 RNA polymerase sigma-70 factor [Pontibacter sp. G13]